MTTFTAALFILCFAQASAQDFLRLDVSMTTPASGSVQTLSPTPIVSEEYLPAAPSDLDDAVDYAPPAAPNTGLLSSDTITENAWFLDLILMGGAFFTLVTLSVWLVRRRRLSIKADA